MNNPHNLTHEERGITPTQDFNKGINWRMSKERRLAKKKRYLGNMARRLEVSRNSGK